MQLKNNSDRFENGDYGADKWLQLKKNLEKELISFWIIKTGDAHGKTFGWK